MALTLDDVLSAPQDPELLQRHLQKMGVLPVPPAPPPGVGIISAPGQPSGVAVKPMQPAAQPQPRKISLSPLTGPNAPPPSTASAPTAPDLAAPAGSPDAANALRVAPMQPAKITPKESIAAGMEMHGTTPHEEGKRQYQEMRPEITAAPGTSEHEEQTLSQMQYDKMHPWGGEISPHPGAIGKIGHVLAKVGNIAGDIVAPGVMANIPGTELNKEIRARGEQALLGKERTSERQQETEESEGKLRASEAKLAEARAAKLGEAGSPDFVLDSAGNIVGWRDEKQALHSMQEENTPQVIKDIAAKWQGKAPRTHENIEQALVDAIDDAKKRGVDPGTDPQVQFLENEKAKMAANKPDTETQEAQRYEDIRKRMTLKQEVNADDKAWAQAYEKRKTLAPFATVTAQAPVRNEARSDKSYVYNANSLDKSSQPVEQVAARLGRMQEALAQHTPTADALIGPELLTIMAGGQGSGLRMTEAEISRIVGGRSHWQDLQAAISKWSRDPSKANSITEDQRKQIRSLVDAVQKKVTAKMETLDRAHQDLLDTDDPKEHRRIVTDAKKKLTQIDSGTAGAEVTAPAGKSTVYDPQGTQHFVDSDKVDKFLKDPKYKGWSKNAPAA